MHHIERGPFVIGVRCTWRPVVSPFTGGRDPCEMFCSPGGTGQVGTESDSGDQARCTLSALRRPSLGGSGLYDHERYCQCRGLRHPRGKLPRTTTEYMAEK